MKTYSLSASTCAYLHTSWLNILGIVLKKYGVTYDTEMNQTYIIFIYVIN